MGYNCDYCGEARSLVYCRSDAAYLCLSCDRDVHSANPLSQRHMRTLVCDVCNSQPAVARCEDEKQSFCQNCDLESADTGQPECSNAASMDSLMSCKTEPSPCYARQQSNISFSSLTGESSGGEYQDCGASSVGPMGEPPWCTTRSDAVLRYKEKKKMRKFEKRVTYQTRKARADVRKRVKGRPPSKAGDAYDYDPMTETRSF